VRQHQIASGAQHLPQLGQDAGRVIVVGRELQYHHQQHRQWTVDIE
jgi:hypothetical protein